MRQRGSACTKRFTTIVMTLALVLAAPGCSALESIFEFRSQIVTGPDGIRTFTFQQSHGDVHIACASFGLEDPVSGTFQGAQGGVEPAWIETEDGRRLSVIWPAGFTVRFEPLAALYNERNEPVVRARQGVTLGQTRWDDAAGTLEDPYLAQGAVFGGCYPFTPDEPRANR
jgi:hypothetical protein